MDDSRDQGGFVFCHGLSQGFQPDFSGPQRLAFRVKRRKSLGDQIGVEEVMTSNLGEEFIGKRRLPRPIGPGDEDGQVLLLDGHARQF